jgi:hypothetical protein
MAVRRRLFGVVLLAFPVWNACAVDGPGPGVPDLPDPPPGVEPLVRDDPAPTAASFMPWDTGLRSGRDPLRASCTNNGLLGSLTSLQTVRDGEIGTVWDDPLTKRGWQADEAWKLGLTGPVFVFGQASAAAEDAMEQDAHMTGHTGLACQLPLPAGELLLRGGPNVTYTDPLRQDRARERSEMLLEVQGRYPLLFGVHLEFDGAASPALSPLDRDWVSHEIRLALPFGSAGMVKLGARQRWENIVEQRPTTDGAQLFLGLEFKR